MCGLSFNIVSKLKPESMLSILTVNEVTQEPLPGKFLL